MDELKTKEGELTTADLASHVIAQKQPNGPKLVKGQEPEALDRVAVPNENSVQPMVDGIARVVHPK